MSKVGFADALRILRGMPTDYLQGGIYLGCSYAKSESFLIFLVVSLPAVYRGLTFLLYDAHEAFCLVV